MPRITPEAKTNTEAQAIRNIVSPNSEIEDLFATDEETAAAG